MALIKFDDFKSSNLKTENKKTEFKKISKINESSFLVEEDYKVKVTLDVPKILVDEYIQKAKDESGRNPLDNFNEAEIAEEIIKFIVKKNLIIDNLDSSFTVGSDSSSNLEDSDTKTAEDANNIEDEFSIGEDTEEPNDNDNNQDSEIEFGMDEEDFDEEIEIDSEIEVEEETEEDGFDEIEFEDDATTDDTTEETQKKTIGDYLNKSDNKEETEEEEEIIRYEDYFNQPSFYESMSKQLLGGI